MIVKFHARGAGKGGGPVGYLLGQNRDREGATLLRGDPDNTVAIIDSSKYAKKYTSGVLSFAESDLSQDAKNEIMDSFEQTLFPGLDKDQYDCLWVEHQDKGRLELNFVVPNIELLSGKRLQPWFERADKPRVNAWKTVVNAQLGLHDPDDPANKRALCTPRDLPANKQEAAKHITTGLLRLAESGEIKSRDDVINTLTEAGFSVARQTKSSISITDPEGGKNIRLKGALYERSFEFSKDLRGEIEAASEQYRQDSQERVRQAREVYQTSFKIKREELTKRHQRPEHSYESSRAKVMALDTGVGGNSASRAVQRDLLARSKDCYSAEDNREIASTGGPHAAERVREGQDFMREDRPQPRHVRRERDSVHDTGGVLDNDRAGDHANGFVEALRDSIRRARAKLDESLERLGKHAEKLREIVQRTEQTLSERREFDDTIRSFEKVMTPERQRGRDLQGPSM